MITESNIIVKIIKDKGYSSVKNFSEKNGLQRSYFSYIVRNNIWTEAMLKKIGDILGEDLSNLVTVNSNNSKV